MKLHTDPEAYLKQQEIFTDEMITRIAYILETNGIKGKKFKS
jgi:hypothetical protein